MSNIEWVVRTTIFMKGSDQPYLKSENSTRTRREGRFLLQGIKRQWHSADVNVKVEMFKVKTVEPLKYCEIRFYEKSR